MANYQIQYFAWCNDVPHDKVWGWATIGDDKVLYNFWGARGKRYTFKLYDKPEHRWDRDTLKKLAREKETAGRKNGTYKPIAPERVEAIVPNFDEEFTHQLALAKLFDNFHGTRDPDGPR